MKEEKNLIKTNRKLLKKLGVIILIVVAMGFVATSFTRILIVLGFLAFLYGLAELGSRFKAVRWIAISLLVLMILGYFFVIDFLIPLSGIFGHC